MNISPELLARANRIRNAIDAILPTIANTPSVINEAASLIKPWLPGTVKEPITYIIDVDLRTHNDVPYRCAQTHTHRGEANWEPGVAPSLWYQCHGTSPETARPFVAEGSNPYMLGEYAIWTDGEIYTPNVDNLTHSPGDYPQGWRLAE